MKKNRLSAVMLALALALSLMACGGSSYSASHANVDSQMKTPLSASGAGLNSAFAAMNDEDNDDDAFYYNDAVAEPEFAATNDEGRTDSYDERGSAGNTQSANEQDSAYSNAKVKLIRRASIRLETKEFDAAVNGLESLVSELGGYIEDSSINQGSYGSTYRNASYTVRVPSKKYSDFLARVSADKRCHLTSKDESTEDVGQQYFDTETRLKTLRTKLERLQTLLEQAKHMEDIINLEQAITDTEYEIESYSSTLNRYDSLIGYATFNVTISQVVSISDTDTIPFVQRLSNSFKGGLEDFVEGVKEFLVWFVGHIFNIALFVAVLAIVLAIRRRRRERRERKLKEQGIEPAKKWEPWKKHETEHETIPNIEGEPVEDLNGEHQPNVQDDAEGEDVDTLEPPEIWQIDDDRRMDH